jgi:hypothetical protein
VLASLACGAAHALLPSAGSNPEGAFLIDGFSGSATSFEQDWLFSLSATSSIGSVAFSQWFRGPTDGLRNLTIELFRGSELLQSVGPSSPVVVGDSFGAFTQLALNNVLGAGSYRLQLSGDVRPAGGSYFWTLNTVAAIPEAETWAMMLIGVGLVGWQLRRKVRSRAAHRFA